MTTDEKYADIIKASQGKGACVFSEDEVAGIVRYIEALEQKDPMKHISAMQVATLSYHGRLQSMLDYVRLHASEFTLINQDRLMQELQTAILSLVPLLRWSVEGGHGRYASGAQYMSDLQVRLAAMDWFRGVPPKEQP